MLLEIFLQFIAEGIKNKIFTKDDVEDLIAWKRWEICVSCSNFDKVGSRLC